MRLRQKTWWMSVERALSSCCPPQPWNKLRHRLLASLRVYTNCRYFWHFFTALEQSCHVAVTWQLFLYIQRFWCLCTVVCTTKQFCGQQLCTFSLLPNLVRRWTFCVALEQSCWLNIVVIWPLFPRVEHLWCLLVVICTAEQFQRRQLCTDRLLLCLCSGLVWCY